MEILKDRLTTAVTDYVDNHTENNLNIEDMVEYLIGAVAELHLYEKYEEEIFREIDGVIVKDTYSKGKNAGLRKAWKIYENLLNQ